MNNYIIKEVNGIKFLQFKKLLSLGINHGFYIGRKMDFRTRNNPKNFINYKTFADALKMDYKMIIKANQNHSANCLVVNEKFYSDKPDLNLEYLDNIDAIITNNKNLVLATTAADCNLIYIYDAKRKVIANVHSGWRGTYQNIVSSTINKMIEVYNSNSANLYCFLNPSICQKHFEVDYDIYQLFRKKYIDKSYYFKKGEKWYIDLKKIIHNELQNIGVLKENIYDCDICSYENTFIHSYRRDKEGFKLSVSYITIKGVK